MIADVGQGAELSEPKWLKSIHRSPVQGSEISGIHKAALNPARGAKPVNA